MTDGDNVKSAKVWGRECYPFPFPFFGSFSCSEMTQKYPYFSRSKSLNAQWEDLNQSISYVLTEHEGPTAIKREDDAAFKQHITKAHWVNDLERTYCADIACRKRFSLTERKHHCRRCGDVFCSTCTQYRRRLSVFATPDPDGVSYRVCRKCFDVGPQTFGAVRQRLEEFQYWKQKHKAEKNNNHDDVRSQTHINIDKELQRLVEGYKKCVGSAKLKNFVIEAFSLVKIPDWQKSKHWMPCSSVSCCSLCAKKFSVTDMKSNCRLCGAVICSSCFSNTLILYPADSTGAVQWALINIIGSPDEEPAGCLYVKICNFCHSEVAVLQGKSFTDGPAIASVTDDIVHIYTTLRSLQEKISDLLPRYENLVNAAEAKGSLKGLLPAETSAIQTIAKYHLDLSDLFTQFAVDMQAVKRLKPPTNMQLKLAKNMAKSMFNFYTDNLAVFRECKKRVFEILPQEVLEKVQLIVDQNAINNAYIYVKQLGLEALLLSDKHKFDNQIAVFLADCENVCLADLKTQIKAAGEEWDTHEKALHEILQINLKTHRLVIPSNTGIKTHGAVYVQTFLVDRCSVIVLKTLRQLSAKTTAKRFSSSKGALTKVSEHLKRVV